MKRDAAKAKTEAMKVKLSYDKEKDKMQKQLNNLRKQHAIDMFQVQIHTITYMTSLLLKPKYFVAVNNLFIYTYIPAHIHHLHRQEHLKRRSNRKSTKTG